jgi:hypothetical protein
MKPDTTADKWKGQVYNAEDGKTYSGSITLVNATTLNLQGCALGGLIRRPRPGRARIRRTVARVRGAAKGRRSTALTLVAKHGWSVFSCACAGARLQCADTAQFE